MGEVINIKPNWVGLVPYFIALIERGTDQGRREAAEYLKGMAQVADMAEPLVTALQTVHAGASVTGRWMCEGEAVGHDEAAPNDGYYDRQDPPDGYDNEGYFGEDIESGEVLAPADWTPYTLEEQCEALEAIAENAALALTALGRPLKP